MHVKWIQVHIVMDRHHFFNLSEIFLMLGNSLNFFRRHTMRLAHIHELHAYFWFRMTNYLQPLFWRLYKLISCFYMLHLLCYKYLKIRMFYVNKTLEKKFKHLISLNFNYGISYDCAKFIFFNTWFISTKKYNLRSSVKSYNKFNYM